MGRSIVTTCNGLEGFKAVVEGMMKACIYTTLFDNIAKMEKSLCSGFNWAMVSLQVPTPAPGLLRGIARLRLFYLSSEILDFLLI
jgi:hypothetical protein